MGVGVEMTTGSRVQWDWNGEIRDGILQFVRVDDGLTMLGIKEDRYEHTIPYSCLRSISDIPIVRDTDGGG